MFTLLHVALVAIGAGLAPAANHAITGLVTDSAGTPLASVRVAAAEVGRATLTDDHGRYRIGDLADGTYRVAFSLVGYAPVVRRVTVVAADVTVEVTLRRTLIELAPLQVTATPDATTVLASPQPVSVVSGTDLRTAQAPTLGETLREVPGVHSLSTGLGIGKPVIRGLTSNRVLVLDNGQRLETQQWGDEHSPNIETATADRIEVIKGPASVLYGSDALGGVINVVPRELPTASGGSPRLHGVVSGAYGANNRQPDGSLLVEGASRGFGFRGTFSGRTSKELRTPDYTLWNSGNEAVAGSGALGWTGAGGSVAATVSQRNETIFLTDEDPAATPTQRIQTTRGRVDVGLPVGRWRIDADVGYERNRRREFEDKVTDEVALGLLSRTWTGNVHVHHAPLGALTGVIGLSGQRNTFDKFGNESLIPNSTGSTVGAFAFEQAELGRWNLSFGARADHRRLDVSAADELGVTAQSRTFNSVTGNFGVLFHLTEPVALVLNIGRGYRAPSSFDLFSNGVHEGTIAFERGNPNLRNETSFNTDLALRVQSSKALFELGGFVNRIQNFIFTVPAGTRDPDSGFEIFDVTQGDATLTGFETSLQYHPIRAIHLAAAVDYTRGQNTSTGNPLPLIPPLRATYSVRFEGRSTNSLLEPYLVLGGETNAKQARQDPAESQFYADAFDGVGYHPRGYTLVKVGGGIGFLAGGTVFRAHLLVRNLFDTSYADYLSRIKTIAPNSGMGRNLTLRLSTDF